MHWLPLSFLVVQVGSEEAFRTRKWNKFFHVKASQHITTLFSMSPLDPSAQYLYLKCIGSSPPTTFNKNISTSCNDLYQILCAYDIIESSAVAEQTHPAATPLSMFCSPRWMTYLVYRRLDGQTNGQLYELQWSSASGHWTDHPGRL